MLWAKLVSDCTLMVEVDPGDLLEEGLVYNFEGREVEVRVCRASR